MQHLENINLKVLLENTMFRTHFEFYTNKDIEFILKELKNIFNINIILADSLEKYNNKTHIIYKESDNSKPKYSLYLSELPAYNIIKTIMPKLYEWIINNAETRIDCICSFIPIFNKNIKTKNQIGHIPSSIVYLKLNSLNKNKSCFNIPALSLNKNIGENLKSQVMNESMLDLFLNNDTDISNYFIDLSSKKFDIVKFKYGSGKNYELNLDDNINQIKNIVINLYKLLNDFSVNTTDLVKIKPIADNVNKLNKLINSPEEFLEMFTEIDLKVDLSNNIQIIKQYWSKFRGKLFTIVLNNIINASINFDTDTNILQIKDGYIKTWSILDNLDIIDCKVENAILENCTIVESECTNTNIINSIVLNSIIDNSYIKSCNLIDCTTDASYIECNENKISGNYINSKIIDCILDESTVLEECYVINKKK